MPALPFPMADLPQKPITSVYLNDNYDREASRRSTNTWSGSQQSYNDNRYNNNDRRTRYFRSTYHNSSGSSANSSFRTSTSQPSPSSSSSTSTASSLLTPPDLLLNGVASSLSIPIKSISSLEGKVKSASLTQRPLYLSVYHLERRLELLSQLSKMPDFGDLPTPPGSPKTQAKSLTESKKRKVDYSSSDDSSEDTRKSNKKRQNASNVKGSISISNMSEAKPSTRHLTSAERWETPGTRNWAKDIYHETAAAYRHRGRELKHRGDDRRRDLSSSKRLASSPEKEALVASFEQMDALLLYTYGFWCEDQASGGNSCIVANWTSLYGLLKYVHDQLSKNNMTLLAGLCRLLEAFVKRHVANHELQLLSHRLSKNVALTDQSPSSIESVQQTLQETSQALARIVADIERSNRMMQQSKQSILNLSVLEESYPRVANISQGLSQNKKWTSIDQSKLALCIDPSEGLQDAVDGVAGAFHGWIWPLDLSTPAPFIVCFGRAILREAALVAKVHFIMEPVKVSS